MNSTISSLKCPKCGFDFLLPSNINKKIFDMMAVKGRRLRRLYKLLSKTIKKELPSDNDRTEFYYFLKAIDDTDERIIVWTINKYLENNLVHKGYGLAYLRGMIRNRANNSGIMKIKEKKMLGTSPPIKEIT